MGEGKATCRIKRLCRLNHLPKKATLSLWSFSERRYHIHETRTGCCNRNIQNYLLKIKRMITKMKNSRFKHTIEHIKQEVEQKDTELENKQKVEEN